MWEKIIFVCSSGTCRAPLAKALLDESNLKYEIEIQAKGLVVLMPEPINQKISAVMISYMASQLEPQDVTDRTLILAMEQKQVPKVLEIIGEERAPQVRVLTELVGEELEIMDPFGAPLPSYGLCFESMSKTIRKLANWLNEQEA